MKTVTLISILAVTLAACSKKTEEPDAVKVTPKGDVIMEGDVRPVERPFIFPVSQ